MKKTEIIDANYPGVKKHDKDWYVLENQLFIYGDVEIDVNLIICGRVFIDGNLIVNGNEKICGSQIVNGNHKVYGSQTVYGEQYIYGHQRIHGNQFIDGDQKVLGDQQVWGSLKAKGNQEITGYQEVGGGQRIKGYQVVKGHQEVCGTQHVTGTSTVLENETNFSFVINQEKYKIYLMTSLIKIGCQIHTPKEWENFTDKEISAMDTIDNDGALQWWKRWRKLILDTHRELIKIYGNAEDVKND